VGVSESAPFIIDRRRFQAISPSLRRQRPQRVRRRRRARIFFADVQLPAWMRAVIAAELGVLDAHGDGLPLGIVTVITLAPGRGRACWARQGEREEGRAVAFTANKRVLLMLRRVAKRRDPWVCTLFRGSSAVEQPAVNRLVAGSNPARGAKITLSSPKFPAVLASVPILPTHVPTRMSGNSPRRRRTALADRVCAYASVPAW
jgi:hypothetical protein